MMVDAENEIAASEFEQEVASYNDYNDMMEDELVEQLESGSTNDGRKVQVKKAEEEFVLTDDKFREALNRFKSISFSQDDSIEQNSDE